METFLGIVIPFLGTTLGAACVFFMKKSLGDLVQRALADTDGANQNEQNAKSYAFQNHL